MLGKFEIIEIEVSGFKRLALSDNKAITINPKTNVHLLLGTNGSGKSSLMELMNMLPPDRKDFEEGGYKKITFRFNSDYYIMYSTDNKHTLYKNNEVVIESTGIKNMLEICSSTFGTTTQTHNFMLNKVNFVSMSMLARKDFITSISNVDFDYVNNLYIRIKKMLRDNIAVQKHLTGKLLSLKEYILNETEITKLKSDSSRINEIIYNLYECKKTMSKKVVNSTNPNLNKQIDKLITLLSNSWELDINKIDNTFINLKGLVLENQLEIEAVEKDLMEMSNVLSKADLDSKLLSVQSKLKELNNGRILEDIKDINRLQSMIDNIVTTVNDLKLYHLEDDIIKDTKFKYKEITDKINDYSLQVKNLTELKQIYKQSVNLLTCPKCHTHFDDTIIFDSISNIDKKINDYVELSNSLNKDFKDIKESMLDVDRYETTLDKLLTLLDRSGLSQYYNRDINVLVKTFIQIKKDVNVYNTILELSKEESRLLSLPADNLDVEVYYQLQQTHEDLCNQNRLHKNSLFEVSTIYDLNINIDKDIVKVREVLDVLEHNRKCDINDITNNSIGMIIDMLKQELVMISGKLDKFNYMITEEQSLSKEITDVENDINLLQILINELNPNTGLIGDSIKSFLGVFISEVNNIINRVWSYPLEVQALDGGDKGITYKFPVYTRGEYNSSDISSTSESMREMINIAFRLVSLKYMGLDKFPLLIDEFGSSMDEVHLIRAYDMLEEMSEVNETQMFIIAHIKTCYNRFKNAGITIVSSLNMDVSK